MAPSELKPWIDLNQEGFSQSHGDTEQKKVLASQSIVESEHSKGEALEYGGSTPVAKVVATLATNSLTAIEVVRSDHGRSDLYETVMFRYHSRRNRGDAI